MIAFVFVALLAGLNVIGYFVPTALTWGFHSLGFLPPVYLFVYLGLLALGTFYIFSERFDQHLATSAEFVSRHTRPFLVLSIAVFAVVAYVLRVRVPLLGDSFFIVKNFSDALRGTGPLLYRNEPLATAYLFAVVSAIHPSNYAQFLRSFFVAELILGLALVTLVFYTARHLSTDHRAQLLSFALLMSLPYVQLLCGYVETYGVVLVMLSAYALGALLYLNGKIPFHVLPIIFLALVLSHYTALALFPSLAYLAIIEYKTRKTTRGVLVGFGMATGLFVAILVAVNFQFDRFVASVPYSHFLSLFSTNDPAEQYSEAYTLLSPYHFNDLANFAVLLSAAPLLLIVLAGKTGWRAIGQSQTGVFFLLALVPIGGFLAAIKFDLGAAKDWDVFAAYGLLLAILGSIAFFPQGSETASDRYRIFALFTFVSVLNTLGYVGLNATTTPSLNRYTALLDKRTVSQAGHYGSTLHLAYYYHQVNDSLTPVSIWENYVRAFPLDPRGYGNVVRNLEALTPTPTITEQIHQTYERWVRTLPDDTAAVRQYASFCLTAGNNEFAAETPNQARMYYQRAITLDSTMAEAYNNLGSVYAQEGKLDSAIALFQKAIALTSDYSDPRYNLGCAYEDKGNRLLSRSYFQQAARLGNPSAQQKLQREGVPW